METFSKCIRYIFFGKTDVSYPPARKKSDLNEVLPENWSFIEDPLKKNLADYLIDNNITKSKENQNFWLANSSPPLTSFLDEYRMENANRSVYNDEFKFCSSPWHTAKSELTQNNSVRNQTGDGEVVKSSAPINIDMNPKIHDCHQAASQCSSKLEELKLRLSNKTRTKRETKTYVRKPKKQFVEASSVEDGFEDAFECDDLGRIGNLDFIEFNNFGSVMYDNLHEVDAALMKIEDDSRRHKQMELKKMNKNEIDNNNALDKPSNALSRDNEDFPKERRKRNRKKTCKFFRIPSQNSDSEGASSFEQSPVKFTSHIELSSSCDHTPSSLELPISFRQSLSSESLDNRRLSTTESEDSFIQFCDEGEDSCSESDSSVFDSDDEDYDDESDSEIESGDITSALSKSVNNLTDDVLYTENVKSPLPEGDQVDCARIKQTIIESEEAKSAGILVNSTKKLANKDKPCKTVRFSSAPPRVKVMRVWAFAARCARAGHWERYVADRDRFKKRTGEVEAAISWVFDPKHREKMLKKIILWKLADRESNDKEATSDLEEGDGVDEFVQDMTENNSLLAKHLEAEHSDELTELEESAGNVNIADHNLNGLDCPSSLSKDTKNSEEHAAFDIQDNIVEELLTEDSKNRSESDIINNPECAFQTNVSFDKKVINAKDIQTAYEEKTKCVGSNQPSIVNFCNNMNDICGTPVNTSQITREEHTIASERNGVENYLHADEIETDISGYRTEENNIIEGFIIPTHKLDIQFSPEVNFVVKDSRMRLDNFIKKNGASNLKNCEPKDSINQMFRVKTV